MADLTASILLDARVTGGEAVRQLAADIKALTTAELAAYKAETQRANAGVRTQLTAEIKRESQARKDATAATVAQYRAETTRITGVMRAENQLATAQQRLANQAMTAHTRAAQHVGRVWTDNLQQVERQMQRLNQVFRSAQWLSGGALLAGGAGVLGIGKQILTVQSQLESFDKFITALGGKGSFEKVRDFALKSPLSVEETMLGAQKLLNYGHSMNDILRERTGLLETMTKAAVAGKVDINETINAFERVKSGNWRQNIMTPIGITPQFVKEKMGYAWDSKKNKPLGLDSATGPEFFTKMIDAVVQKYKDIDIDVLLKTKLTNIQDAFHFFLYGVGKALDDFTKPFLDKFQAMIMGFVHVTDSPAFKAAMNEVNTQILGPVANQLLGLMDGVIKHLQQHPEALANAVRAFADGMKLMAQVFIGASIGSVFTTVIEGLAAMALLTKAGPLGWIALVAAVGAAIFGFKAAGEALGELTGAQRTHQDSILTTGKLLVDLGSDFKQIGDTIAEAIGGKGATAVGLLNSALQWTLNLLAQFGVHPAAPTQSVTVPTIDPKTGAMGYRNVTVGGGGTTAVASAPPAESPVGRSTTGFIPDSGSRVGKGGKLSTSQQSFVNRLAQLTGMSPQVLAARVDMETGHKSKMDYNYLNVGHPDYGYVAKGAEVWNDPITAAEATAAWWKGEKGIYVNGVKKWDAARKHGKIGAILASAGQSDAEQWAAWNNSPWQTAHVASWDGSHRFDLGGAVRSVLGIQTAQAAAPGGSTPAAKGGWFDNALESISHTILGKALLRANDAVAGQLTPENRAKVIGGLKAAGRVVGGPVGGALYGHALDNAAARADGGGSATGPATVAAGGGASIESVLRHAITDAMLGTASSQAVPYPTVTATQAHANLRDAFRGIINEATRAHLNLKELADKSENWRYAMQVAAEGTWAGGGWRGAGVRGRLGGMSKTNAFHVNGVPIDPKEQFELTQSQLEVEAARASGRGDQKWEAYTQAQIKSNDINQALASGAPLSKLNDMAAQMLRFGDTFNKTAPELARLIKDYVERFMQYMLWVAQSKTLPPSQVSTLGHMAATGGIPFAAFGEGVNTDASGSGSDYYWCESCNGWRKYSDESYLDTSRGKDSPPAGGGSRPAYHGAFNQPGQPKSGGDKKGGKGGPDLGVTLVADAIGLLTASITGGAKAVHAALAQMAASLVGQLIPGPIGSALGGLVGALLTKKHHTTVDSVDSTVTVRPENLSISLAANPSSLLFAGMGHVGGAGFDVHVSYAPGADKMVTAMVNRALGSQQVLGGAY